MMLGRYADKESSDHHHTQEDVSESGSYNLCLLSSPTRHVRKMGTVKSNLKPMRMSRGKRTGSPTRSQRQQRNSSLSVLEDTDDQENVISVKGEKYVVLKVIGKGGSSEVYQTYDKEKNLRAIKKVNLQGVDEEQAQGYLNEVEMLDMLQGHNRIIKLFGWELKEDTNQLFVVMERGDVDLMTFLKKKENEKSGTDISVLRRKYFWSEMLEAVQVIHNKNIIHSDLKPTNFLLVEGTLKLIDFGIASSVQSDKTSVIKDCQIGTLNYMSPEALNDLSGHDGDDKGTRIKISRKTDIWSLGCILYYLTYGRLPFSKIREPLKKILAIVDPNHQIEYPYCSDACLVDTMKRCLVRNPQDRASVEELLSHPYLQS